MTDLLVPNIYETGDITCTSTYQYEFGGIEYTDVTDTTVHPASARALNLTGDERR